MDTDKMQQEASTSRSLREWTGGGTKDEPAPEPGPEHYWWRVSYAPVGNKLSVALMGGEGARARVLALDTTELSGSSNVLDQEVADMKEKLIARHLQARWLIAKHSGSCELPSNSTN